MRLNSDTHDAFFYLHLAHMKDTYILPEIFGYLSMHFKKVLKSSVDTDRTVRVEQCDLYT